jgi:hypothetical protein
VFVHAVRRRDERLGTVQMDRRHTNQLPKAGRCAGQDVAEDPLPRMLAWTSGLRSHSTLRASDEVCLFYVHGGIVPHPVRAQGCYSSAFRASTNQVPQMVARLVCRSHRRHHRTSSSLLACSRMSSFGGLSGHTSLPPPDGRMPATRVWPSSSPCHHLGSALDM